MGVKYIHHWIILQCPIFCPSVLLPATPSRMFHAQITVLLQLHWTLTNCQWYTPLIERQKNKHKNSKFEDVGLKHRLYLRLDSMKYAAQGYYCGSTGAQTQIVSLICWHLCQMQYLWVARKYLGCGNLQNSMCQGGISEQRSWMLDTGRQWTTRILRGSPEVVHLQS